ncbi:MAG: DUF6786 family protein [Vicinamibacteria bacterium]
MRNAILALAALVSACGSEPKETTEEPVKGASSPTKTYGDDVAFLEHHLDVTELSDASGKSRVAVVGEYQGRVMTSTSGGASGPSYGWIHREAIASGERKPHINVFGGEDRFWLGPEGGQYSIFFEKDDPFDLEHWQTPEPIDWGAWEVVSRDGAQVQFQKSMDLVNYAGTRLTLDAFRTIRLVDPAASGIPMGPGTEAVAYESENTITNRGENAWTKETGLLSIWILGMFNPSPTTTVVLPFMAGPEETLGPTVNDAYFGTVPRDRLVIGEGVLYFRGDGEYRSKIGLSRKRALPIMGSYDGSAFVLTLVEYTLPENATDYVNSMWELQGEPYRGDVVNSYNDGPPAPGAKPLGPFYELESSSPAAALSPGESLTHVHQTFHFRGPEAELDAIVQKALGVSVRDIVGAFP